MYRTGVIEKETYQLGIFYDKVIGNSQIVGYLSYGAEAKDQQQIILININHWKLHKCYLFPSLQR
jgi:hypothetical protein